MTLRARTWLLVATVSVLALAIGAYRFHHDRLAWDPDGTIYLRLTLQDRGATPDAARREANAYVRTLPAAADPEAAGFYTDAPPAFYAGQFALYRSRPLYPLAVSLLYPRLGPDAMRAVEAAGYVASVVLMMLFLLRFTGPALAAIGALALATSPWVLEMAAMPEPDDVALALWIAALWALYEYFGRPAPSRLLTVVAVTAVLTFVRPAVFLPFGAALGVFIGAPRGSAARTAARNAALAIFGVGVAFGLYTLLVHGPGIAEQMRWLYDWQTAVHGRFTGHGFLVWWAGAVAFNLALGAVVETYRHAALFAIVLAVFGWIAARRTLVAPLALGGLGAAVFALLVNPTELNRTVTLPLTPIVVLLATIALSTLAARLRGSEAAV
ncbi:MAG TPA: hypothetical protein VGC96_12055 [Candidatus Elarobacter sp.]